MGSFVIKRISCDRLLNIVAQDVKKRKSTKMLKCFIVKSWEFKDNKNQVLKKTRLYCSALKSSVLYFGLRFLASLYADILPIARFAVPDGTVRLWAFIVLPAHIN